jgi:two-component sensor histidine kinase/putative methionine-R-sulfoxide reductase with GAF domain
MSDAPTASAERQTLDRVREYQRVIEAISRIGPQTLSAQQLMQHVVAQVSRATMIPRTKVLRYRAEKGDLLIEAGVGWRPGVVGNATLAVDYKSPAGRAFQTGGPVTIEDIRETDEFRNPELLREHGIISIINVPVLINGATWGVLEADSTQPGSFDQWDVSFLSTVANIMGVCLGLAHAHAKHVEAAAESVRQEAQFDMRMRELQHRIKNNLQIVVAFLSRRTRELPQEVREALSAATMRIQAIALAHDLLSVSRETRETSNVAFDDYLRSLCANIDPQRTDVTIEVAAEKATIPIDRAVPAGLIVNELVTNSIKYAFGNGGGLIRVHFATTSNRSEAWLTVEDNGKGMKLPPNKGLGLSLVEGFVQQIQGRVEYVHVEAGSKTTFCFPATIASFSV